MNESERIDRLSPLKRALLAIEKLEAKVESLERARTEPIAVVGLGCRFPGGATSPEGFRRMLRRGECAVTEIPADRWDAERYYDPDPTHAGSSYTRHGSFLERVYDFDPFFFGIAPREALGIDPQQRLLLEVAWEALEDAAIAPGDLAGSAAGVFVGLMANDYSRLQNGLRDTVAIAYAGTGTADCFAAGRLSYALGLQGASMTVETACSSSLVGIHLACQGLRNGEFDLALAGGVNLMLSPGMFAMTSALRAIAADGRCKTFDASADGYGRGEGCGVVVLRRLSDAVRDGDRIQALIRGSAVNHDGASGGLTVPNGMAQQAVIRAALGNAGVEPREIGYVEAHGTGTSLGDPIELRALGAVLGRGRANERPVMVGSVKTNFGHTEAAAGVAGLIKTVEVLRSGEVPPHLHMATPNPLIAWDELPVTVPTRGMRFDAAEGRRIAGVSSFSLSGTNAHVVLEEAPPESPRANAVERPIHVLALSAKDEAALAARRADMEQYLASHESVSLGDVCFTANAGRSHFAHRVAVVANSHASAREKLKSAEPRICGSPPRIAFLFTGQGSQYAGMARGLYQKNAAFAGVLDKAAEVAGGEIVDVLLGQDGALLEQTRYTQPCLYILEYALARMWRSWGIEPAFVMGHSVGEFAAAATSGLFSFEDGLRLIVERGRTMQELPSGGSMLAVMCSESKAAFYAKGLSVAAINGPESVVFSGKSSEIEDMQQRLRAANIHCELLRVSHAFHSALMEPMLPAFGEAASRVAFGACRIPMVSNLTGKLATSEQLSTREYWVRHVREAVRFRQGVETLRQEGCEAWIEIGPHPVLVGMARPSLSEDALCLPSMRRGRDDWEQMLDSLAKLYTAGANVNWKGFDAGYDRRKVSLPSYPFQRQTYRLEVAESIGVAQGDEHSLPGRRVASALEDVTFEMTLAATSDSMMAEHRVFGKVIAPGAWMVATMVAGARQILGSKVIQLEETAFEKALVFEEATPRVVQTIFSPDRGQGAFVRIYSQAAGEAQWLLHASARYSVAASLQGDENPARRRQFQTTATEVSPDEFYKGLRDRAIEHGPRFRRIVGMWRVDGEALGRIGIAPDLELTPGVIDSCFQLMGASLPVKSDDSDAYVPAGIGRLVMAQAEPIPELWCEAVAHAGTADGEFRADLKLSGPGGEFLCVIEGLRLRRVSAAHLVPVKDVGEWICEPRWIESPRYEGACGFTNTSEPAAAVRRAAPGLAATNRLDAYGQLVSDLEKQSAVYAYRALDGLSEPDVVPSHRRLFARLREMVAEESGVTAALPPMARPQGFDNELDLFAECGRNLAGILTGKVDPLEILFPGGSGKRIEGVYRDSPYAKVTNGLVQAALAEVVRRLPAARGLRILEVGGGTGGTTAFALNALPDRTDYLFTDVAPALAAQAREKFASDPRVRVAVLDIEKEPREAETFDIVLAANVLHATKNLAQTLRHVRQLLRPEGLLVIVEGSGRQRWLDLVFGLTDGWWRFDDGAIRNGYPLIEPEQWRSLLAAEGFSAVEWTGANPDARPTFDQTLMIARGPAAQTRRDGWIVVSDSAEDAPALSAHIRESGCECGTVNSLSDYRGAFEVFSKYEDVRWRGVVHAGGGCVSVLRAVKAITVVWPADPPRLWLVTRDAQSVEEADAVTGLAESALWGMAKVIALEHPELRCTCVDLDLAERPDTAARGLFDELTADTVETLIGFRSGARYLQRLAQGWQGQRRASRPKGPFELISAERGVLDTLTLKPVQRRKPSHGEVEIEVAAAGLNFHDVLEALGLIPDELRWLGGECVGTVVSRGPGVTEFKTGDSVMVVVPGAFARYVTTGKALVVARPSNLSEEEAATVPIAFLTAWHSLVRLAKVKKGDRVLIHAAAGGVGLAAVQIAKRAGAIVFGTAGNDSKRQYVKSQGVDHVLDSRSLGFADEVLRITNGEGVDVVLNSLAGDFIDRSFSVLKAGGRFVEIGKANIRSEREAAERTGGSVEYFIYDLIPHVAEDPETVAESLREILALMGTGEFKPLCRTVFDIEDAVDAFRYMQRARHTGKIVLRVGGAAALEFRPDASYLITGGLSGLGLEVARWMTEKGARELVLMGRSAPKPSAEESIGAMRQAGACVSVVLGDVSRAEDVARALSAASLPLRGIMHSAGVLSDGVILQQTAEKFTEVMAPKVEGAWNLHRQTLDCPLDFFVLFSSAASLLGLPGQSNHAAANAFLDMLAHHRRAERRPALSINWGAWDQIGAAAGRQATKQARMTGVGSMQPAEGLEALELLMTGRSVQAGVLPIDWTTFARQFSEGARPPFLRDFLDALVRPAAADSSKSAADSLALNRIKEAPPADQLGLLADFIKERALRVLGIDASRDIDPMKPLNELGLDSLMAVELRNALGTAVGRTLPYTVLFEYPTLDALTNYLAEGIVDLRAPEAAAIPPEPEAAHDDGLDDLSEDDMAALLSRELAALKQKRVSI